MSSATRQRLEDTQAAAPGLEWRSRANGQRVPYWIAPKAARTRGYRPASVKLPADASQVELAASCRQFHAEALEFIVHGDLPARPGFDGTLKCLVEIFQTHKASPFNTRYKWNTRDAVAGNLKILSREIGGRLISRVTVDDIQDWYAHFRQPAVPGGPERIARATTLMAILRRVLRFGIVAEDQARADCIRLAGKDGILAYITFEAVGARTAEVTADMVDAFCAYAHKQEYHALALATAIQFETGLRQADVIGQWMPRAADDRDDEPGPLCTRTHRWTGGLVWSDIDSNLVMVKKTSKSGFRKPVVIDWNICPMIRREIAWIPIHRRIGPVVLQEQRGRMRGTPWRRHHFSHAWATLAAELAQTDPRWVGVSNMDMRSGAITEAFEGIDQDGLEAANVQKVLGTHSNAQTTARYNRATLTKSQTISRRRVALRNASKT
jgi:hypothetical protein